MRDSKTDEIKHQVGQVIIDLLIIGSSLTRQMETSFLCELYNLFKTNDNAKSTISISKLIFNKKKDNRENYVVGQSGVKQ